MRRWEEEANRLAVSRDFSLKEFECPCCRKVILQPRLLKALQAMRDALGGPLLVTSGHRCKDFNARIGGYERSKHMIGAAADVLAGSYGLKALEELAREAGLNVIPYPDRGFLHLEVDLDIDK